FGFLEFWDALDQIGDVREGLFAFRAQHHGFCCFLPESSNVAKAYAQARDFVTVFVRSALDGTEPIRLQNINWPDPQAVTLCIFYDRGRTVEAHGLIVEQGRSECGEIVAFQIGAGVGDQSKACRMGFGETITGKGSDLRDDLFLCLCVDSVSLHAMA